MNDEPDERRLFLVATRKTDEMKLAQNVSSTEIVNGMRTKLNYSSNT